MSTKENDSTSKKSDKEIDKPIEKAETDSLPSLEKMPPPFREFAMLFRQTITRSAGHSLLEKFNDDHIHKTLDSLNNANEHQYELEKIHRRNRLIYVFIGVGIFIFLALYLLPKDKDTFSEILRALTTIGGGIGIGGGYVIYKFVYRKK
jgi:hypothetical protein